MDSPWLLPVEDILLLSGLMVGCDVLVDGYEGTALLTHLGRNARTVIAHNPHCAGDGAREIEMIALTKVELFGRQKLANTVVCGYTGVQTYTSYPANTLDRVLIDPERADQDVPARVRRALDVAPTVYLVNRDHTHTAASLGYRPGPDRPDIVPLGRTLLVVNRLRRPGARVVA